MAITTNDGLIAAIAGQNLETYAKTSIAGTLVVGRTYGLMGTAGQPGTFTIPTTLAGSVTTGTTLAGAVPYNNAQGATQKYLNGISITAGQGSLRFYDMLWWNGGHTVTSLTAQTINSPTLPARDNNGTTNGEGTQLWLYVSTVMGAGTPTLTVSYTNSDGTAGRTATVVGIASIIAGTMLRFNLQSGDKGVRSVQSITQSATWTSGVYHLMILRPIGSIDNVVVGLGQSKNFYDLGTKLYDGTCIIGQLVTSTTSGPVITGNISMIEG